MPAHVQMNDIGVAFESGEDQADQVTTYMFADSTAEGKELELTDLWL